ncbi:MAG TPA: DUF58 domain-containing protein [Anaerolineales bacterium]
MKFDEKTIRKLTRLTLVAGQVRAGVLKGERRSTKRGSSLEFADYRSYSPGDDLRRIDWNAYARLDRPFLKLFEEEEDLAVHVLVDTSRSMDWGPDEHNKFQYALKLAAALGAIALSSGDRLTASGLHAGGIGPQFGPARGQLSTLSLLRFLESQHPGGETDLYKSLREYALAARRPGLVFLISDLFSQSDALAGLALLQSRGYEVALLHLLAPDEIDPPFAGDLRLVDAETGQAQDVSLDGGLRNLYQSRLQAWRDETGAACRKRGIRYLELSTAQPWERVILQEMRQADLVR